MYKYDFYDINIYLKAIRENSKSWGYGPVIEHLLIMHEALGSILSIIEKKKHKRSNHQGKASVINAQNC
jgi:hypothetical protein